MSGAPAQAAPTLDASLREARLVHRRKRLRPVVGALRARMDAAKEAHGTVPGPLLAAVAGFEQELATVEAELLALRG